MKTFHVEMNCVYFDTVEAENEDGAIFQMEQMYSDDWDVINVEEIDEELEN